MFFHQSVLFLVFSWWVGLTQCIPKKKSSFIVQGFSKIPSSLLQPEVVNFQLFRCFCLVDLNSLHVQNRRAFPTLRVLSYHSMRVQGQKCAPHFLESEDLHIMFPYVSVVYIIQWIVTCLDNQGSQPKPSGCPT